MINRNNFTEMTIEDYNARTEEYGTELIQGQYYAMASPSYRHQQISFWLSRRIADYIDANKGSCVVVPAPFDVYIEQKDDGKHTKDTVVVPDISVVCDPGKLNEHGCKGAPDWIIEVVSPGNAGHDYIDKLYLYKENGVREYWIVDPQKEKILVHYFDAQSDEEGIVMICGFSDKVRVHIYEDFAIDFSELPEA